ncbi:flavin-containing monooxygenase [Blastococcus tunisiensis]|uniref:Cyclohexanone monooxygenase n=1 Tax=Blastococcus tunisiensis TaxID=1798228 RepID=A0A1I2KMH1_9ACTN|nr:NAD(P)/FAD-dependent oxidoreductase [Blastococcus sp. DSM 46838]SFF68192.1 cyclohexanone monooxygenase [Blastococcus sp. DSM 46838]
MTSDEMTINRLPASEVDVVIVGAGIGGVHALYEVRRQGLNCRLFDSAGGVGGTWYWNRYPGVRVDIESVEYSYAFDEQLQQDWEWTERYAAQPELLRYVNHVVDRFDMRSDLTLNSRIESAVFDEADEIWTVTTSQDEIVRTHFLVVATGFVSAPSKPHFPGAETFKGKIYHSGHWPHEGVDFTGQRVGVVGTGSSAVQMTPVIAQEAAHLTVFQRTAPYIVPLRNCPMPPEYLARVKANYKEWRAAELKSFGGYLALNFDIGVPKTTPVLEASPEEWRQDFEERWQSGGLSYYTTYPDVFSDLTANELLADFIREKSRERIADPALAEILLPKSYDPENPGKGFPVLAKRLVADNGYYEAFARDNVSLVDVKSTPIQEITENGILVGGVEHELDAIVLATGYDAVTGAMLRIHIVGRDGKELREHWDAGPRTHLGLMSAGYPNMFIIDGPGSPGAFFQPILLVEYQNKWVSRTIVAMRERGLSTIEPTPAAEAEWTDHVTAVADGTLFPLANSWYMGANIPGKPRVSLMYLGGFGEYSRRCALALEDGHSEFEVSPARGAAVSARRGDEDELLIA